MTFTTGQFLLLMATMVMVGALIAIPILNRRIRRQILQEDNARRALRLEIAKERLVAIQEELIATRLRIERSWGDAEELHGELERLMQITRAKVFAEEEFKRAEFAVKTFTDI